jgi:hypothetical protein
VSSRLNLKICSKNPNAEVPNPNVGVKNPNAEVLNPNVGVKNLDAGVQDLLFKDKKPQC